MDHQSLHPKDAPFCDNKKLTLDSVLGGRRGEATFHDRL